MKPPTSSPSRTSARRHAPPRAHRTRPDATAESSACAFPGGRWSRTPPPLVAGRDAGTPPSRTSGSPSGQEVAPAAIAATFPEGARHPEPQRRRTPRSAGSADALVPVARIELETAAATGLFHDESIRTPGRSRNSSSGERESGGRKLARQGWLRSPVRCSSNIGGRKDSGRGHAARRPKKDRGLAFISERKNSRPQSA